jgi:Cupin domain
VKACGSVTAQAYTLIQVYLEPRGSMPSHRHAAFEEGIYVLDGSIQATLDGETYEATAGIPGHSLGLAASDPECGGKPRSAIAAERSWRGRGLLPRRMQAVPRWHWQDNLEMDLARLRTVGPRFGIFE